MLPEITTNPEHTPPSDELDPYFFEVTHRTARPSDSGFSIQELIAALSSYLEQRGVLLMVSSPGIPLAKYLPSN